MRLTCLEYRLLHYLMMHQDRVISRTELIEHLYDQDFDRDSNTIEVFVGRLRKKIGPDRIETVRGLGYRLTPPARRSGLSVKFPDLSRRSLVGRLILAGGRLVLVGLAMTGIRSRAFFHSGRAQLSRLDQGVAELIDELCSPAPPWTIRGR